MTGKSGYCSKGNTRNPASMPASPPK